MEPQCRQLLRCLCRYAHTLPCRRLASLTTPHAPQVVHDWTAFHAAFPWGAFLADGGCKRVYDVWCKAWGRHEAVSVMDVLAIADSGNLPLVRQEVGDKDKLQSGRGVACAG